MGLNSNFEDWRRANPDTPADEFKFSPKKLNPAGALFDYAKLTDVSKNVIAKLTADEVYALFVDWAKEFDPDFAETIEANSDLTKVVLAIGRGGKKPRKDIAVWPDVKPYMGFFFDNYFASEGFDEKFDKAVIRSALEKFLAVYDANDDATEWFNKVKSVTDEIGFASDMKEYKANPEAYLGSVADVSNFLRVAVTGKTNSPDLYTVMQILGAKAIDRIRACVESL